MTSFSSSTQESAGAGHLPLGTLLATLSSPWKPALAALELQERLVVLLRLVLRDRVLWEQPPGLLGSEFAHCPHWQEHQTLNTLSQVCYEFVVIHRFQALRLLAGEDDTLVNRQLLRQVRDFIEDRQRRFDPIGYAVWCNTQAAVVQVVEQGFVHLRGRRDPLGGNTWLLFGHAQGQQLAWEQLGAEPGWVQMRATLGRVTGTVQERLALYLARLAGRQVQACQFRDLVAALQHWCRQEQDAPEVSACGQEPLEVILSFIQPDLTFGDWEGWRFGMAQLEDDIDTHQEDPTAQRRCRHVLAALLWYVEADQPPPPPARLARELDVSLDDLLADLELLMTIMKAHDPT